MQLPVGRDEVASGRLEAVEWNKTLSENKVFNSFSFSPLEGATNPYTEANYKPTFLSDDELKHLILRVCCNYGIVFTQHLFSQISALSASVWEFNVSTLNLFRLTSCVRVSILEVLSKANAKGPHVLSYTLLLTRMHGCATPGWEQGAKLTMQSDSCVWLGFTNNHRETDSFHLGTKLDLFGSQLQGKPKL